MTIPELIQYLRRVKSDLAKTRANEAYLLAREGLALIRRRIQTKGEKSTGAQLGDYSDTPLPPFFFFGRSANGAGEAKVKAAAKKGQKISYKDFRDFNNRETAFVDLTFTGAMWREMDAQITANSAEKTTATISPRTERSRKVARYNSQRYGDILGLSKLEISQLKEANRQRIIKIFRLNLK
jgi:hypothetical protein